MLLGCPREVGDIMKRKKTSHPHPRKPKASPGHQEHPPKPTVADELRASGIEVHTLDTLGKLWSEQFESCEGDSMSGGAPERGKP